MSFKYSLLYSRAAIKALKYFLLPQLFTSTDTEKCLLKLFQELIHLTKSKDKIIF